MRVLLDLDPVRPAVLDGIAQPSEQADAGISGIGKDELRTAPMPINWS